MKKIARPLLILLPVLLMTVATVSEARSFSSRGFGSSKLFKRPVQQKAQPTAAPAPTAQQTTAASGKKGIPGAEQYRSLSQQAPSQRLKNAINSRGNSGVRLTQLAMLYWLLSSNNTHASELTEEDRDWVKKEIKEREKNGEKLEEHAPAAASSPAKS